MWPKAGLSNLPCQPQLVCITPPPALNGLVAQVVLGIEPVCTEEVAGIDCVDLLQQAWAHANHELGTEVESLNDVMTLAMVSSSH